MAAVSADGSTVCVLIRRLNSSCTVQPLDRICGAHAVPLARWQPGEAEQAIARFLEAVGDGTVLEPPLADEGLATGRSDDRLQQQKDKILCNDPSCNAT